MPSPRFTDAGDHWVLPLAGRIVHRCCVDAYSVALESLQPEPRAVLTLTTELRFTDPGGSHVVDVEKDRSSAAPLLALVGRTVERAAANKQGALELVLDDGSRLVAGPDDDYEGWQLVEDTGFRAIQVPQQGVVIWHGAHSSPRGAGEGSD